MNVGSIIERVQKVGDLLEKLIQQSNELRDRVIRLEDNANETSDQVAVLDAKVDRQTALVRALAEDADVDPERVYADNDLDGPIEAVAGVQDDEIDPDAETAAEQDTERAGTADDADDGTEE